MCGIFGVVTTEFIKQNSFKKLVSHSKQRGVDSSGLISLKQDNYYIDRSDFNIE